MSYNKQDAGTGCLGKTLQIIGLIGLVAGALALTGCSGTVLTKQESVLQQQLSHTTCSQGVFINVINRTQPDPRNYEVQLETEVNGNLAMMTTGSYRINVWHMDTLVHSCSGIGTGS